MINAQTLQGNWNEIKGKLRNKWGQLSNDDLQAFDGNVDRLVGLIQRKTGEARESVMGFLNDVSVNGSGFVGQAAEGVKEYAHQAAEKFQEGSHQAVESLQHGYESLRQGYAEAEGLVRRRPSEAAAVCFGVGILTGLVIAVLARRN
jgi:uncharacterized protein YjbJ (UPF0337 family)